MLMLAANETARIQRNCTICKFHSFLLVLDNCIFTLTNLCRQFLLHVEVLSSFAVALDENKNWTDFKRKGRLQAV